MKKAFLIALSLVSSLAGTLAFADGNSPAVGSDYRRKNIDLRMRKGEIDVRDYKDLAEVGTFTDGSGQRITLEGQIFRHINAQVDDPEGTSGFLFEPGARIVADRKTGESKLKFREFEVPLFSLYSVQKLSLKDRDVVTDLDAKNPLVEKREALRSGLKRAEAKLTTLEKKAAETIGDAEARIFIDGERAVGEALKAYDTLSKAEKEQNARLAQAAKELSELVDALYSMNDEATRVLSYSSPEYLSGLKERFKSKWAGYEATLTALKLGGVLLFDRIKECGGDGKYVPLVRDKKYLKTTKPSPLFELKKDDIRLEAACVDVTTGSIAFTQENQALPPFAEWVKTRYEGATELTRLKREAEAVRAKADAVNGEERKALGASIAQSRASLAEVESKIALKLKMLNSDKSRPVYATHEGRVMEVGLLWRDFEELGVSDAAFEVNPVSVMYHIAGVLNGMPVGFCASAGPTLLFGKKTRDGETARFDATFDPRVMACLEAGQGKYIMFRLSGEAQTDIGTYMIVRANLKSLIWRGKAQLSGTREIELDLNAPDGMSSAPIQKTTLNVGFSW